MTKRIWILLFLILQVFVLFIAPNAQAYHIRDNQSYEQVLPLDRRSSNHGRVVFRGSRPTDKDFEELQRLGVRTVLNLESSESTNIAFEDLGFKTISVPLPSLLLRPPKAEMWEIVQILEDPKSYPLYIHCKHGRDRTGLVVALYRVLVEHVNPEVAYQEMKENGFHDAQIGLKCAFFETLDLPTPKRCKLVPRFRIKLNFE